MLSISLFGGFQVKQGERAVRGFRSDSSRALLAYLCLEHDRPHLRDALAMLLRPNVSDDKARTSLRTTVYRLRGALDRVQSSLSEQVLATNRKNITWRRDDALVEVDALVLAATLDALDEASADQLEYAVSLYKGAFLHGFELKARGFGEWLERRREQYHNGVLRLCDKLGDRLSDAGEWERVIEFAQRQLTIESWHEAAFRRWMVALAQQGQRTNALAVYDRCCAVLENELGVTPSAETHQLAWMIRNEVTVANDTQLAPHNLPGLPTALIGRKQVRQQLEALLHASDKRLITLLGMGGIGKTHLALTVAHAQLSAIAQHGKTLYWHGVYYVSLDPQQQVDSDAQLAQAILNGLSPFIERRGIQPAAQRLIHFFGNRRALLIIDNFENAYNSAKLLAHLLAAAPNLTLLVTSRVPLHLRAEYLFDVPLLTLPADDSTDSLAASEAVQLFQTRAQQHWRSFEPTASDQQAIFTLCQQTEGLPLALEMAASCIRTYTPQQISEQIGASAEFLNNRLRDTPRRQQSIEAVFESSWRLLNRQEQAAFLTFTVFRGGFTREAALAVANVTAMTVDQLHLKSLLQWDRQRQRYHIHPLLLEYGVQRLEKDAAQQVADAHSDYFITTMQTKGNQLDEAEMNAALQWFEREIDNITAAWQWAVGQRYEAQLALGCETIGRFFELSLRFVDGVALFTYTIEQLAPNPRQHCRLLTLIARLQLMLHQLPIAIATAQQANEMAIQLGDRTLQAQNQLWTAAARYTQGNYNQSRQMLAKTRPLCESSPLLMVLCDQYEASINYHQANYRVARPLYRAALKLYEDAAPDYPKQRSIVLNNLGNVALRLGQYDEAQRSYEQSIQLRQRIDRSSTTAIVAQGNLGLVALAQQRFDEAAHCFDTVLDIHRRSGQLIGESRLLGFKSDLHCQLGLFEEALSLAERDLAIVEKLERPGLLAARYSQLALVWLRLGDVERAGEFGRKSLQSASIQGEKHILALSRTIMGEIHLAIGDYEAATAHYEEALALRRVIGQRTLACEPLAGLAAVALVRGKDSAEFVSPILQHLQTGNLDGTYNRYDIYRTCCAALVQMGQPTDEIAAKVQADLERGLASIDDDAVRQRFSAT